MKREHFVKVVEEALDALPKDDLPAWLSGIAPTGAAILARSLQRRSAGPDTKSESPQPESVVRGVDKALWPHFDRPPCRNPRPLASFVSQLGPPFCGPSAEHAQWVRGEAFQISAPRLKMMRYRG